MIKPKDIKQAVLQFIYSANSQFKISDVERDKSLRKFRPNRLTILMHLKPPLNCGLIREIKRGLYEPNVNLIDELLQKLIVICNTNYYFIGDIVLSNGKNVSVKIDKNSKKYYIILFLLRRGKPFTKKELAKDLNVTVRFIEENVTSHPLIKCINPNERIHKFWFC